MLTDLCLLSHKKLIKRYKESNNQVIIGSRLGDGGRYIKEYKI